MDIPSKVRPTDDGRFLYRFRGRDYLLTREQALRHGKQFWDYPVTYLVLFLIAVSAFFPELALDSVVLPLAVGLVVLLVWLLGNHWRTAVLLEGCDYRAVPKAKGMVARGVQWLEYNRSIYLRNDPPPIQLFVYCLAVVGIFVYVMLTLWPRLANHDGLEFAMDAVVGLATFATCLVVFAVPFYALCRAIARNRA
jgi:hypothetical protein